MIRFLFLVLALTGGITGGAAALHIDDIIKADLGKDSIFGAVIAVVHEGDIVYLKAYGSADQDVTYPLDPEDTLLPIGSITKLFTWEAAERLAEDGLIDPDADVNHYLPYSIIPETYTDPITITHLMTHTSGLDERITGIFTKDPEVIQSPFVVFSKNQPARVRPPGHIAGYSNSGALLAGAIIEEISGIEYTEFIRSEILMPANMHSTGFDPLPPDLAARSPGITLTEGIPVYTVYLPSGGMHSTAEDMALYMIDRLQSENEYPRIFSHDERLPGITQGGYIERYSGKQRILTHAGDVPGISSLLALDPESDLGIFICYTGTGGTSERYALLKHFFLDEAPGREVADQIPGSKREYAGTYISSRIPETGYEKITRITADEHQIITVLGEGDEILIGGRRFIEAEPGYFLGVNNPGKLVFDTREGNNWLFMSEIPTVAFRKAAWHESPALHTVVLIVFAGIFSSATAIGGIRYTQREGEEKQLYGVIALLSGTATVFLILFFGSIRVFGLIFGTPPLFGQILWIPIITAILSAITGRNLLKNRVGLGILLLLALYLGWLHYWNLLIPPLT